MKRAVEGLRLKPAKVLVDGNRLPALDVLAEAIVGGDAKVKSISAASILAKVHRDRLLQQLHEEFPQYGFAAHKGYGTPEHLEALRVHGACRTTAASSARWRAMARAGAGASSARRVTRARSHPLARQRAAQGPAPAGAGQHGLPQAGPRLAGGRPPLPRRAAARRGSRPWPCSPSRSGRGAARAGAMRRPQRQWWPTTLFARLSGAGVARPHGLRAAACRAAGAAGRHAPAWCSTGCRTPATSAPSCAAPAAFGFRQVLAIKGTAALWRPKVLRAGMGAHFGAAADRRRWRRTLDALAGAAAGHQFARGRVAARAALPWPCAWVFGHEGQGVSAGSWRPGPRCRCASCSPAARSR